MPADNRKQSLLDLAKFCEGIIPTVVSGSEANAEDAIELGKDLLLIADKVDRVIAEYGEYVHSIIGLSKSDQEYFRNQLRDAIEPNAVYLIGSAVEDRIEARRDDYADYRRQQMRDDALVGG